MTTERRLRTMEENFQTLTDLNQTLVTMMAAQEARVDDHAQQMASIRETNQTLATMLASHDDQMASIRETNQTLAELTRDIAAMLASHDQQLASIREDAQRTKDFLAEAREDNRMTRNLWVRLARRYGWLEDDDLQE